MNKFYKYDEEQILNVCPYCGSALEYHDLQQFSTIHKILKSGRESKKTRRSDIGPMECGFIACSNNDCDFHTNDDLEVEDEPSIIIWRERDIYKIEIES